jgi:ketosteroid isomerase-like protein
MSKENVELVKAIMPREVDLVEILKGDDPLSVFIGSPLDSLDPDINVVFEASHAGGPPVTFEGVDGLLEGWRDWLIPWEAYRITVERVVDAGDEVVVAASVSARTERHGVEVRHRPASVWTLRNGKIVTVRFFLEQSDAFDFAGVG